jgi:hypothetical protein
MLGIVQWCVSLSVCSRDRPVLRSFACRDACMNDALARTKNLVTHSKLIHLFAVLKYRINQERNPIYSDPLTTARTINQGPKSVR